MLTVAACTPGPGSPASSVPGSSSPPPSGSPGAAACPTTPAPQGIPDGWDIASQHPSVFPQLINPGGTIACGETRLVFSFLDAKNVPVGRPDRTVDVQLFDLGADPAKPVAQGTATFIWAIEPSVGVYAFDADITTAGRYGIQFTTTAKGAAPESIRLAFDVQPTSSVVSIGDKAPASTTPTLADVGGDVAKISTDTSPVTAFYETSVAAAVAAKKPFVVAFATPKFCTSKQCGPTLDRLKPIAASHPDVTFINVEPYQLKDVDGQLQPVLSASNQLQTVPATDAYGLLTEPFVFVVGGDGIVKASFELIFTPDEIAAALDGLK